MTNPTDDLQSHFQFQLSLLKLVDTQHESTQPAVEISELVKIANAIH